MLCEKRFKYRVKETLQPFRLLMHTFAELFIPIGMLGGALVYPILQFVVLRRAARRWRFWAFLPVLPMGFVLSITVYAFWGESNVWPILRIFTSPPAVLYLLFILFLHNVSIDRKSGEGAD